MILTTMTSFLCQMIVVVDDIWGWKNIYNSVIHFLNPNIVSSINQINHGDIEMVDLPAAPGQELYHPALDLNHNAEFPEHALHDALLLQHDCVPPQPPHRTL